MRRQLLLFILLFAVKSLSAQVFDLGSTETFFADSLIDRHTLIVPINNQSQLAILKGSIVNKNNSFYQLAADKYKNEPSFFDAFGGNSNGFTAADIDLDGDLDIFQYCIFGQKNSLFINKGNGVFEKSLKHENICFENNAFHASFADVDLDGDPDLLLTNTRIWNPKDHPVFNKLFLNNGSGLFQESADLVFLMNQSNTRGAGWSDIDNDGDLDLMFLNFGSNCTLTENLSNGKFMFRHFISLNNKSAVLAADFGDINNDGKQDLVLTHVNQSISILLNKGDFKFDLFNNNLTQSEVCNGSIRLIDLNNDGALDIYSQPVIGKQHKVAYQQPIEGNWVKFKLRQDGSNFFAIGAKVYVKTEGKWQFQELQTKTGMPATHAFDIHFGLANANIIDSIKVIWTDGRTNIYKDLKPNQNYLLTQNLTPQIIPKFIQSVEKKETLSDLAIQIHSDSMKLGGVFSVNISYQNIGLLDQEISIELQTNEYCKLVSAFPKPNENKLQRIIWNKINVPAQASGNIVLSMLFEDNIKSILSEQQLKAIIFPLVGDEDKSSNTSIKLQSIIWNPSE